MGFAKKFVTFHSVILFFILISIVFVARIITKGGSVVQVSYAQGIPAQNIPCTPGYFETFDNKNGVALCCPAGSCNTATNTATSYYYSTSSTQCLPQTITCNTNQKCGLGTWGGYACLAPTPTPIDPCKVTTNKQVGCSCSSTTATQCESRYCNSNTNKCATPSFTVKVNVFEDTNSDGVKQSTETNRFNQPIEMRKSPSTIPTTKSTSTTGIATFSGLGLGTYTFSYTLSSEYEFTLGSKSPTTPKTYTSYSSSTPTTYSFGIVQNPCLAAASRTISCPCTDNLQCESTFCNTLEAATSGTCDSPPEATATPTETPTPSPSPTPSHTPTPTPIVLSCDPDKTGDSLNTIDEADYEQWRKEYVGEVTTTLSACLSPNNIVELLGFQIWKDIAVYKIKQPF